MLSKNLLEPQEANSPDIAKSLVGLSLEPLIHIRTFIAPIMIFDHLALSDDGMA